MRRVAIICLSLCSLAACEEEQTFRTVHFRTQTQNQLMYHVDVGIPPNAYLINQDTTGPITLEFSGQMGDTVVYALGTNLTFIHAELVVNGEVVMVSDLSGTLTDKQIMVRYLLR